MDFATESAILKVLKSLKEQSQFRATFAGVSKTYVVTARRARRGRNGYISLYVRALGGDEVQRWTISMGCLPLGISNVRAIRKQRVVKASGASAERTASNNPFRREHEEDVRFLTKQVAELREKLGNAQSEAFRYQNLYAEAVRNRAVSSGRMSIGADAMQFLRFSGIEQFPCSAEELKKGRAKMIAKLHPDTTQKDSNAQFCSAMRGFEELLKLAGGR